MRAPVEVYGRGTVGTRTQVQWHPCSSRPEASAHFLKADPTAHQASCGSPTHSGSNGFAIETGTFVAWMNEQTAAGALALFAVSGSPCRAGLAC
jgi:hypothetical protein